VTRHFTSKSRCLIISLSLALFTILATLAPMAQTQVGRRDQRDAENHARPEKSRALPQDGSPLFLGSFTYSSGATPSESVAIADVNGDGKPDLIVANQSCATCAGGSVSVLLGKGDGTFQPYVQYDSGGFFTNPVAVADINHDGRPDIVVANSYGGCPTGECDGTVAVLLGNGDGTFQPPVLYELPAEFPDAVALADLNGDGKLDLVVGIWNEGLAVLMGNGDGTFQPATLYSGLGQIFAVSIADVNHDGKPDVIVAGIVQTTGTITVLLGKGDGTFQPALTYPSGAPTDYWATAIAAADMDGDGKLDLVVANYQNGVGVLRGNGDGTFQPVVLYSSGGSAESALVTDVDGDGIADVVVGNINCCSSSVGVLLGNGDGTLQPAVSFSAPIGYFLAAGDLNGDGTPDIVAATDNVDVYVFLNNTGPHTPTTTALASSRNPVLKQVTVTYTATVTGQSGTATGSVTFYDNGTAIGTAAMSNNQASYSTVYKRKGSPNKGIHSITATYSGDLTNASSTSPILYEGVGTQPFSSGTSLGTSGSPSMLGQPVTFTATVTSSYGTIPDGELVTFYDGSTEIGTGTTASALASFTTSSLTARKHTIKAEYAGDAIFKKSIGKVTQVVK
jgi:hypothetical protein